MNEKKILLETLKKLLAVQFEELVYYLSVPIEYLPASDKEQAERAIKLLRWAEAPGGCGLGAVKRCLGEIQNDGAKPDRELGQQLASFSFKAVSIDR